MVCDRARYSSGARVACHRIATKSMSSQLASSVCATWASRKILAHRVAITLEATHAVEALEEAFVRYGLPDIVNTDEGSQFTAATFTEAVLSRGVQLSMDGKGARHDNVFVERVWRSITLKHWMGSTHFQTRRLDHVVAEMSLHVLAYNLKRVIRILGFAKTRRAMKLAGA